MKQMRGVGGREFKGGQVEEMKITADIKRAHLLLTHPGLVAVCYM